MNLSLLTRQADELLNELTTSLLQRQIIDNVLLDMNCPQSSKMRGILLGRKQGAGASWDELWVGRLQEQVPYAGVMHL